MNTISTPSDTPWQKTTNTVFFACIAALVIIPIYDFDIFWHLANGRAMLEQGRIVQEELFSYTARGVAFENNQWLAQIILYVIHKLAGDIGLIIFTIAATLTTLILILRITSERIHNQRWIAVYHTDQLCRCSIYSRRNNHTTVLYERSQKRIS